MKTQSTQTKKGRMFTGTVVSAKMKDTVVVEVTTFAPHPKYRKYMKSSSRLKAQDTGNTKKEGDKVTVVECRPLSKDKNFKVIQN